MMKTLVVAAALLSSTSAFALDFTCKPTQKFLNTLVQGSATNGTQTDMPVKVDVHLEFVKDATAPASAGGFRITTFTILQTARAAR